jgi:lysine-N-methylase
MPTVNVPDYYPQFGCIGSQCEDTCCGGWSISIDRDTYHKYKNTQLPALAPLMRLAVSKNTSPRADSKNNFAVMAMRADGSCHFLQEDRMCSIHGHMGAQALSNTCRIYPRYLNRFGAQRENALGVSCPEAARLVLLNPQPMQFITVQADPDIDGKAFTSYAYPLQSEGDPKHMAALNDMRAVIIGVLQCRELVLGARLMVLGFLMDEAHRVVSAGKANWVDELLAVLGSFVDMLAHPAQLEAQFAHIAPNTPRKLEMAAGLITRGLAEAPSKRYQECLEDAAVGLRDYPQALTVYYAPYFQDKTYIFENYLVNQVLTRLFPFTRGSYLDLYRSLIGNLALIQVLLVGIAAKYQGLNEALVVQLIQTFARHSNHSATHQDKLIASMRVAPEDSFVHAMWLLKD